MSGHREGYQADAATGTLWGTGLERLMFGAMVLFLVSEFVSIAVNSIALGVMTGAWAALMLIHRRWLVRATPLDWFFLAYVVAEILATVFSENRAQSLMFSKRVLLIAVVYFFATWITSRERARLVMVVLLGSATAVSLFGVGKLLFAPPESVTRLGIFQFYMTTSELLMMSVLLTIPFVIHPRTPLRIRLAAGASLVPLMISLYATVTRGAYLAAAAGLLFLTVVRNRKLVVPLLAIVILFFVFAPPYVSSRLQSIVDLHHPENVSRVLLWTTGIRIFLHYPVFGVGDIDLREMYVRFATAENPEKHGHLHNVPLQILVTLGTVGFIAFVALFVRIAQTEWRSYRHAREDWLTGSITLGALGVFVGFLVMGMTEWSFGDQEVVLLLWISVGMAMAAGGLSGADPAEGKDGR